MGFSDVVDHRPAMPYAMLLAQSAKCQGPGDEVPGYW